MEMVSDSELERLAAARGPDSLEANTLAKLRRERAQDKQVFAFRLGEFYVIGPVPDAQTEIIMLAANEYAKRMKGTSKPVEQMTEAEVIEALGEPDEIVPRSQRMTSLRWQCATCLETVESLLPITVPAPCGRCGGIAFKTA